jgi:uncharacterized protein YheU (UPF0270 family)
MNSWFGFPAVTICALVLRDGMSKGAHEQMIADPIMSREAAFAAGPTVLLYESLPESLFRDAP